MDSLDSIVSEIKKKKELSGVSREVVLQSINDWTNSFSNRVIPSNPKELKILVKEVRAKIRKLVGRFSKSSIQNIPFSLSNIPLILSSHSSTKEREDVYPWLIDFISSLKVSHILDLGCGINPLVLANPLFTYDSIDIEESNLDILRDFYKLKGIKGFVKSLDLRRASKEDFPSCDLTLLFKVLDLLDSKGHKNAERLINLIDSKYILVSFSTKTLSGKPMNHPQRGWIERLALRLGFTYSLYNKGNEIFYLLKKSS